MLGGVRRGRLAAQEQGDGVGAGFAEGAAAEFGDGDDVEILEQDFAGLDVGAVAVAEDGGGQDDGGDAAGLEQLLGALDEKGFDAVVGVELVDGVGERVGGAFVFGQGFEKAFDAVGRVGDEEVETASRISGKAAVLVDQGVAVADVDFVLAVHEGGNLGDFGKPVFLFDADDGLW